jgi:ribosomal protein S6--L-glutamate ligase
MILSYHPCVPADENRLCAGREPAAADRQAMERAAAVILPQGCRPALWHMAHGACRHVFPDYAARFGHPGKCGQLELFRALQAPHPASVSFAAPEAFHREAAGLPLAFPLVFKFDWGGEGEGVELVGQPGELAPLLARAAANPAGSRGFVLQELIPSGGRSVRVVVIGGRLISYWRVAPDGEFQASLARGGEIERRSGVRRQRMARDEVRRLCLATGINLAGFDLLFDERQGRDAMPLLLEINWFFGREGLGGSQRFYRLLRAEIRAWLAARGLVPGASKRRAMPRALGQPAPQGADSAGEDHGPLIALS